MTALELRGHLPDFPSGDDATAVQRIADADWLVALWLGYPRTDAGGYTLEQATYTLYPGPPSPYDERLLRLPLRPVISVTSAHDSADWDYSSADEIASGDWVLDGPAGKLWLKPGNSSRSMWSTGARQRKIVVEAGVATVGDGLKATIANQVRHMFATQKAQSIVARSANGQSISVQGLDAMIAPAVRASLASSRMSGVFLGG